MAIYRERVFVCILAGIFAISLGFWANAFITQVVQPAVSVWIASNLVHALWASIIKAYRDPMNSIFGIPLRTIIIGLITAGTILIFFSLIRSSADLGTIGVLCLLFAVDTFLSGKESIRRIAANSNLHRESS